MNYSPHFKRCASGMLTGLSLLVLAAPGRSDTPPATQMPAATATSGQEDALAQDKRLETHFTLELNNTRIDAVLRIVTRRTGIQFQFEGNEVANTTFNLRCIDLPLRDLLYGIAGIRTFDWKRGERGALILCEGFNPHTNDAFRPQNQWEAKIAERGRDFVKLLENAPADLQKGLYGET